MATGTKDKNPSQKDYEDKFDDADKQRLRDIAETDRMEAQLADQDLYEKEQDAVKKEGSPLKPDEQAKLDQMETGLREDDLYEGEDGQPPKKLRSRVAGAFSGRRKYGWIGGGVVGLLITILMIAFPALAPVHILSNYSRFNFDFNDSQLRDRTGRYILKSVFTRNKGGRNFKDTPFLTRIDLIDFQKFEARMQARGWDFNYNADGKPTGLIDPDRNIIDLEGISRAEYRARIQPLIDDTIPAWRMNKRIRTRILISTFTGPIRSFKWTKLFGQEAKQAEPDFDKRKFLKESGLDDIPTNVDGATSGRQLFDEDGNPVLDENGNPVYEQTSEGSVADQAKQVVLEELDNGSTKAVAVATATDVVKASFPEGHSLALMTLVVGCISYSIYEQDLVGDFERFASALRIGSTFSLATHEIQEGGDIDLGEVGQLVNEYNNESGTFAASASFQRATGSAPTGQELDPELHVIEPEGSDSAIQSSFEEIGSFFAGIGGMDVVCKFVNSVFFVIFDLFLSVVEVIVGCLATACLATAGKVIAIEVIFELVGRLIAASLTNFVGFLVTHPVQAANFLDQALNLISTQETRAGTPVDDATYNSQVGQFILEENRHRTIPERYFALENTQSLASKLSLGRAKLLDSSPSQLFSSLLKLPQNSLVAALTSDNVYAQVDINFDNYGFQKYSYADAYAEVDPLLHAEEIIDLFDSGSDEGNKALEFAEKCMGYDHERGLIDKNTTTKMLPQFSDPAVYGTEEAQSRNDEFQSLCIDDATSAEHKNLYSRVGRFVSDLELITSVEELSSL